MSKQIANNDIEWVRLQDMMRNVLDAAKELDWQRLIELNELRQPVLEKYFNDVAPSLNAELLRDRIYILQKIEKQILQYSQTMRDNVAAELKGLHRGKRAEQAYSGHVAA